MSHKALLKEEQDISHIPEHAGDSGASVLYSDLLCTDFVAEIELAAKIYIGKTKSTAYDYQLTKTILDYVSSNAVFISDIHKLLSDDVFEPFRVYDLYCENPYKHAVMLTNKIHELVGKWVRMETKITHTEFVIQYDFRDVVRIYSLTGLIGKKHIAIEQYINPIMIDDIRYLPPDVELIDIYHKLYLPNYVAEWKSLLDVEYNLYNMVNKRTIQSILHSGAADSDASEIAKQKSALSCMSCKVKRHTAIAVLRLLIFQHFIKTNFIVVGGWAKAVLLTSQQKIAASKNDMSEIEKIGSEFHVREKLQVISAGNIESDMVALKIFLRNFTEFNISYHEHNMYIPKDFRVRRYTVRIHYPTESGIKEKPLMDIFNAASYELISYREIVIPKVASSGNTANGIAKGLHLRVGTAFVLLRFAMIDLLIIKMIGYLNLITSSAQTKHLENIVDTVNIIRQQWLNTAFSSDYFGTDVDYGISKKIEDLKRENMHKPYIPELALKEHSYKIIY